MANTLFCPVQNQMYKPPNDSDGVQGQLVQSDSTLSKFVEVFHPFRRRQKVCGTKPARRKKLQPLCTLILPARQSESREVVLDSSRSPTVSFCVPADLTVLAAIHPNVLFGMTWLEKPTKPPVLPGGSEGLCPLSTAFS